MSGSRDIPAIPEIDQHGGDELPSYDELAAQNGPNSRFGRWRAWIEKRAAERYADLTPEVVERRRQKGWGEGIQDQSRQQRISTAGPSDLSRPGLQLQIQTEFDAPDTPPGLLPEPDGPQPSIGEVLSPTRLELHQFGSRFLPHTTSQIRCLLPVLGDNMLLIGHDDGLSVLNMFPKEWSDEGLDEKGPNEAEAHHLVAGEGFYQMTLLESESTGDGTPQGVVLALVGPPADSTREQEGVKAIRMYNLASLVSLTKWAVVQPPGVLPLRLGSVEGNKGSVGKHHKGKQGITRGLKNLKLDNPSHSHGRASSVHAPYPSAGASPSFNSRIPLPARNSSGDSAASVDSSWDVIEDLPLRWATDFVPLASPGTRLHGTSVLFYDMWRDPNERNRGVAYLAVVVKTNILLYHAPKGERAFRFVKEFYTPITARSLTFVQQAVQETMGRSPSDAAPRQRNPVTRHLKGMSVGNTLPFYPSQLSLFVIFEKKAGLIRIADAAVGEVELYDDGTGSLHHLLAPSTSTSSLTRRSRSSWDGKSFVKDNKAPWIAPHKIDFFERDLRRSFAQSMYVLTRGKHSHVLPHPLPANIPMVPPYRVLHWSFAPSSVCARVFRPADGTAPAIHFIAFGEDGLEVQEVPLARLSQREGGKARDDEPVRVQPDVGGLETGFLVGGGHWHKSPEACFVQTPRNYTDTESEDMSLEDVVDAMQAEEGVYGWVRRGTEDWRVIWLGGEGQTDSNDLRYDDTR